MVFFLQNIFYYAHVYLLWLILFIRLNMVFDDTIYKLTLFTKIFYKSMLCLLPILIPTCLIIALIFGIIVVWMFYIFLILFSLSLSLLFVFKLGAFQKLKYLQILHYWLYFLCKIGSVEHVQISRWK